MPRKQIDEKTRRGVIKAYGSGVPRNKIAERFGISPSSVTRIVKKKAPTHGQEKKMGPAAKTERQKRIEDLERRIAELEKKILEFEANRKAKF